VPLRRRYFEQAQDCTAGLLLSILASFHSPEVDLSAQELTRYGFRRHTLTRARAQLVARGLIRAKQSRYSCRYQLLVQAEGGQHWKWRPEYVDVAGSLQGSVLLALLVDQTLYVASRGGRQPRPLSAICALWFLRPRAVRQAGSLLRRRSLLEVQPGRAWASYTVALGQLLEAIEEGPDTSPERRDCHPRMPETSPDEPEHLYFMPEAPEVTDALGAPSAAPGPQEETMTKRDQLPQEPERRKAAPGAPRVIPFPAQPGVPPPDSSFYKPAQTNKRPRRSERQRLIDKVAGDPLAQVLTAECKIIPDLVQVQELKDAFIFLGWLRTTYSARFTEEQLGDGIKRFAFWFSTVFWRGRLPRPRDYRKEWDRYREWRIESERKRR
jgi:hypothetical protein